jgi:hypothetical protein
MPDAARQGKKKKFTDFTDSVEIGTYFTDSTYGFRYGFTDSGNHVFSLSLRKSAIRSFYLLSRCAVYEREDTGGCEEPFSDAMCDVLTRTAQWPQGPVGPEAGRL